MADKKLGFVKGLFFGKVNAGLLIPYPKENDEESQTIKIILDSLKKFAREKIDAARIDAEAKMPQEVISGLGQLGILGMATPEEFGGLGLSQFAYAKMMEELGKICGSTATFVGAHQSIGMKAILLFGTEEQKKKYLSELATGDKIAAFALTEPNAGSDAGSIQTTATLSEDGSSFILNGSKHFITNAGIASLLTVFAKQEIEIEGKKEKKISAFIITRDMPGITMDREEEKMGIRGSVTNGFRLENVKIPKENLLGEPGKGFKIAMEVLNYGRLGLAAGCLGASRRLLELSLDHAKQREQFGKRLCDFEMIKHKLSDIEIDIFVMESIVDLSVKIADRKDTDFSIEAAICKIFASEALWRVVNNAVQINGGDGYMKEYPYERFLRDARINMIFEGTNEILRLFISLDSIKSVGIELKKLVDSLKRNPLAGVFKVIGVSLKKCKGKFCCYEAMLPGLDSALTIYAKKAAVLTKKFSCCAEKAAMKYGRKIVEKEFMQERLSDIAINLYAVYCVIARVQHLIEAKGKPAVEKELNILDAFFDRASTRIEKDLNGIFKNKDKVLSAISDKIISG